MEEQCFVKRRMKFVLKQRGSTHYEDDAFAVVIGNGRLYYGEEYTRPFPLL